MSLRRAVLNLEFHHFEGETVAMSVSAGRVAVVHGEPAAIWTVAGFEDGKAISSEVTGTVGKLRSGRGPPASSPLRGSNWGRPKRLSGLRSHLL